MLSSGPAGRLNVISSSSYPSSRIYSSIYWCLTIYLKREKAFNPTMKRLEVLVEVTFQCEWVLIKIQSVRPS